MKKMAVQERIRDPKDLLSVASSSGGVWHENGAAMEKIIRAASQGVLSLEEAAWSLAEAVELRDPYTGGHIRRVLNYSLSIAKYLDFPVSSLKTLELSAVLHDIGKIAVAGNVLGKKGPLDEGERAMVRNHPVFGSEILARAGWFEETIPGMLHHHERLDGSGYPFGLKGREIPWIARIIAVADSYDAMTSSRPYRRECPPGKAMSQLIAYAGSQFDREAVNAFFTAYRLGEVRRAYLSALEGHA